MTHQEMSLRLFAAGTKLPKDPVLCLLALRQIAQRANVTPASELNKILGH